MATLGAEIAAARLMAPFFGASTIVWANTIAIVLVALSIGYWFGGRMADRHHPAGAVRDGAGGVGAVRGDPVRRRPVPSLSVEAFDSYSVGAFAGSLFGVLVLVAVPVLMMGGVAVVIPTSCTLRTPQTGRPHVRDLDVGSLVGTFAASLLLIPIGTPHS